MDESKVKTKQMLRLKNKFKKILMKSYDNK